MSLDEFKELRRRGARSHAESLDTVRALPRGEPSPLSFAQERLWFLERLGLIGAAYNMPSVLHLQGRLDLAALTEAFAELVRRHESLRTRFDILNGKPVQVIAAPPDRFPLGQIQLEATPGKDPAALLELLLNELTDKRLDLRAGPLIHVTIIQLGPQDHVMHLVMHLVMHHMIADGWSLGILFRELAVIYDAHRALQPAPLPMPQLQFADYAAWHREWLKGDEIETQLSYWKRQLSDASPLLNLPTDRKRPAVGSFKGAMVHFFLSRQISASLRALGRRRRRDAIHDDAGGSPGSSVSLERGPGHFGRLGNRESPQSRD
jgi:hypothetical protein